MPNSGTSRIPQIIEKHESDLLAEWLREQLTVRRSGQFGESELRAHCTEFLKLLAEAMRTGGMEEMKGQLWNDLRNLLADVSRTGNQRGLSPSDTVSFVLSFKNPLFARLRRELAKDGEALGEEISRASFLLDQLGLWTMESYLKSREDVIRRQQEEMLELSTPVIKLWDGILALPLIGTLDSARSQIVMESLLTRIVETGSAIAIIDITGVPTVDTLTAQHLLKTVTAARLMGAECIISGIRPQIAQTIVHLGVELNNVATKASLADAFAIALARQNLTVARVAAPKAG